jgi:tRNA(Ile2) C34 agmatinyltransferase TiaS
MQRPDCPECGSEMEPTHHIAEYRCPECGQRATGLDIEDELYDLDYIIDEDDFEIDGD